MSHSLTLPLNAQDYDPDLALVLAAQSDSESFGALYERYLPRIYCYLAARSATTDEAADLTQAVFLKAFDALPRYRVGSTPFSAWLFRVARNAATDSNRRRRPVAAFEHIQRLSARDETEPEAVALRRERIDRLRLLLADLDSSKRDLLALRFGGGLSSREIGAIVGKTEAAVKKQLTRVLAQLKESYPNELA